MYQASAVLAGFAVRVSRRAGYTAILPFGIMCISSSWADNCTGFEVLVTQNAETTDLGHGLHQMTVTSHSVLLSNDSVYNMVEGECSGSVLQTADGKTQSTGYCTRRDIAGDTESVSWRQAAGVEYGEWKSTGGSGKYAGRQDSGWFHDLLQDGKIRMVQ